jgi:hypothetical protein
MPTKRTITQPSERLCPWCETMFHAAPDQSSPLCPDCRSELLEQSKEFLVDMLGHVSGVNLLTMAAAGDKDDLLERTGMVDTPKREGLSRRPMTMKQFARKRQRVQ